MSEARTPHELQPCAPKENGNSSCVLTLWSCGLLLLTTFVWFTELRFKTETEASRPHGLLPLKQLGVEGKQTVAPQGVEPESGVALGVVDQGPSPFAA